MQPIMDEFQGLLLAMHPTLMMGEHKKSIEAATNMQEQMLCATNRTRPPPPSCQTSNDRTSGRSAHGSMSTCREWLGLK